MDGTDDALAGSSKAVETLDIESGYVTRKRRPKKKANTMPNDNKRKTEANVSVTSPTKPNEESVESDRMSTNDNIIYGVKVEDGENIIWENVSQTEPFKISKDSHLKAPPEIDEPQTPTAKEYCPKAEVEPISSVNIPHKINTKPLLKNADTYELEKFEKNALLVFNQENIVGYKKRYGTDKDVEQLKATFSRFGFEVTVKHDSTKDEIMETLEEFFSSDRDFTDFGCVGVVVLTHGSSDGLIRAKDKQFSELQIINRLKIDKRPTLATKPKIVIIQACRGGEDIEGVPVFQNYQAKTEKDHDEEVEPYTLPVEADMLILHSSYIGKPSHRHELLGSWFIQSLCKKINELAARYDLESILTEVKREVAIDYSHEEYNRKALEFVTNKQMPVTTSTLIRKLYLKKFGEDSTKPQLAVTQSVDSATVEDKSVLDNAAPSTPMLLQYGRCLCFLEHYEYMKKCLQLYVADNPEDFTANSFYDVACTMKDGTQFNGSKESILQAISLHLTKTSSHDLRYLHPYCKKQ